MATTKKPIEIIDFDRFYTMAQLGSFADGDYEIIEERMEIRVHGTTVTQTPVYKVRPVGSGS